MATLGEEKVGRSIYSTLKDVKRFSKRQVHESVLFNMMCVIERGKDEAIEGDEMLSRPYLRKPDAECEAA